MIIQGEEGYDMRFAQNGRFGMGNYFAIKSSYSTGGYQHTHPDGKKGIFLAKVLIGDPAPNVDQNRKMPPIKDAQRNIRYDSVTDNQ